MSDTIVNAQTVKTFAAEKKELNTSKSLNKTLLKLRVEDWQRAGISGNNRWSFLLAMIFLLLIYINYLAKTDPMVLGIGVFSFTFTFTIMLRLFDINTLTRQVEEAFLQASPMTKILLEVDEVVDSINASELVIKDTTIEFNDVSFDYNEGKNNSPVFKNLNLHIKSGEKVGLVGPSGGGKSTLTRLILRFEDIQSGSIRIDNQNITLVTQKSLRESVAYVPQEPLLFHRSISENIGYGANCDLEEIVAAARLAYADEFIANLPNGYDTIVGERGVKLSGGQRQRVAIARAILRNSPILILDEATSALDSESEVYIQKALQELMKQKTTIVIAHRLSTIQKMDRIIVMDDGKIIEQGTHAALLSKDGMYARLWNHQSGGFLQEDPED